MSDRKIPRVLFHMSPCQNHQSIMHNGLLPDTAKSSRKRVWVCDSSNVERVAKHLAKKAGLSYAEFQVYAILATWLHQFTAHPSPGVWTTGNLIAPRHIEHAYTIAVDMMGVRSIPQPVSLLSVPLVNTTLSGR